MSQPENALERLMNRTKPKVPPRSDLVEDIVSLDIKTQRQQDLMASPVGRGAELPPPTSVTLDSKTSLRQDSETDAETFETVRNTIRLDASIDQELRRLCSEERITKETWFEAAYLYLSQQPEAMDKVVNLAQNRLNQRKQIADYRRAVAMQKRIFGNDIES